jgi:hypothetical protein
MSLIEDQQVAVLQILEKLGAAIQNLELRVSTLSGVGNPGGKTPWGTVGDVLPPSLPKPEAPPSWVPAFESGHYKDHWGVKYPMSELDFATAETATEVAVRLNATVFNHAKFSPNEDSEQRWLKFPNGTTINAGRVADNWLRAPEGQFPGVALAWAKTAVEQRKGLPA